MGWQKKLIQAMGLLAMVVLILDGKYALSGAQEGLKLCLLSVIPSLFPYLFLSSLLTNSLQGAYIPGLKYLGQLMGIPRGAEGILVSAMLGGYPAGAQTVAQLYETGLTDRKTAKRLLMFCSNAGPAFLFGMVARQFPDGIWSLRIWLVQLASLVMTAIMISAKVSEEGKMPVVRFTAAQILERSVRTMGLICGWIILFRMALAFLDRWVLWILPDAARVLVYGILELSNGCLSLSAVEDLSVRFLLANGMVAFGGLCVVLQTASVVGPLGIGTYLQGKLLQTGFSILLSLMPPILVVPMLFAAGIPAGMKKEVAFFRHP